MYFCAILSKNFLRRIIWESFCICRLFRAISISLSYGGVSHNISPLNSIFPRVERGYYECWFPAEPFPSQLMSLRHQVLNHAELFQKLKLAIFARLSGEIVWTKCRRAMYRHFSRIKFHFSLNYAYFLFEN